MTKNSTINTKEKIINAAEKLFASTGFLGTSLRAIVREADVNLAAIYYHFRSKEELFIVVVKRVAQPIVREQLRQLKILEESEKLPSIPEVLTAFVTPPLRILQQGSDEKWSDVKKTGFERLSDIVSFYDENAKRAIENPKEADKK